MEGLGDGFGGIAGGIIGGIGGCSSGSTRDIEAAGKSLRIRLQLHL